MTGSVENSIAYFMERLSLPDPGAVPARLRCGAGAHLAIQLAIPRPVARPSWWSHGPTNLFGIPVEVDEAMDRDVWQLLGADGRGLRSGVVR